MGFLFMVLHNDLTSLLQYCYLNKRKQIEKQFSIQIKLDASHYAHETEQS